MSGRREERRKTAVSLYSCRGGEGGRGAPSTANSEGRTKQKKCTSDSPPREQQNSEQRLR